MIPAFTRRRFLNLVGAAGGSAAVYQMAMGLGLVPLVAQAQRPDLSPLAAVSRLARLLVAARLGRTRLIDNIPVIPGT